MKPEFLTLQRLDFDLLVYVETGAAAHTVDFTDCFLRPGDVLWVRAGQVHRWGAIEDLEGAVVMFGPHTVDHHTGDLIRWHMVRPRSHWTAAELEDWPVPQALELLTRSAGGRATGVSDLRQAALKHSLAALLVQLALVEPPGSAPLMGPAHEAYGWFRDHIQEHFHEWHKVSEYADRLGYSARTLNRLARQNTASPPRSSSMSASSLRPRGSSVTVTNPSSRSPRTSASTTPRTSPPTSAGTPT